MAPEDALESVGQENSSRSAADGWVSIYPLSHFPGRVTDVKGLEMFHKHLGRVHVKNNQARLREREQLDVWVNPTT